MLLTPLLCSLALCPLTQDDAVPIRGTVLGPAGKPAHGVLVALSAIEFRSFETELLEEVATGADGRFHLNLPVEWLVRREGNLHLFAAIPGAGMCALALRKKELPVGQPVTLRLPALERSSITILDPDGKPVPGARVALLALGGPDRSSGSLPPEWVARFECASDERGVVHPELWGRQSAAKVRVVTDAHGHQEFYGEFGSAGWLGDGRIQLRAVGEAELAMEGEPPAGLGSMRIELRTHFAPKDGEPDAQRVSGRLVLFTGRGESLLRGTVLAGTLSPRLSLEHPEAARLSVEAPTLEAGGTARVVLKWNRGVEVRGSLRDEASGEGIAGARLRVFAFPVETHVASDAQGEFRLWVRPGAFSISEILAPPPFLSSGGLSSQPRIFQIPAEEPSFDAGEIAIARECTLAGRLVDRAGTPVAGALVMGELRTQRGGRIFSRSSVALADREGHFELGGLARGERIQLSARIGGLRTSEPVAAVAGQGAPAELHLTELLALVARVSDAAGQPLPGVELVVWCESPPRMIGGERKVAMRGAKSLSTDRQGRATSPLVLLPDARYCVEATAAGSVALRAGWRSGRELAAGLELVLRPCRRVTGRVCDSAGEAVAGARIQLGDELGHREGRTGADGIFAFDGVAPRGGFLVIEDERCGIHGRLVGTGDAIEWRLSEARAERMPLDSVLSHGEELALARELLEPIVASAVESKDERAIRNACKALVWVDPGLVLEKFEEWIATPRDRDWVLVDLCGALAGSSPDEALAVVGMIADIYSSIHASLRVIDALPASARGRKVELLSELVASAERVEDPARRLIHLGKIAERLLDLGERAAAEAILRRGQSLAAELPAEQWAGFARANFAEELAQVDLGAALKIVAEMAEERDRGRHLGNIAHELAGIDPAAAEEVLESLGPRSMWSQTRLAPRICYRMAPLDLERARRLAMQAPSGRALGLMALALAERDRAAARELLAEAFEVLQPREHYRVSPATAAELLIVAERVSPERLDEYLWRAVALRRPTRDGESFAEPYRQLGEDARLAFFVARYDRALASALMQPVFASLEECGIQGWWDSWRPACAAAAVVAPRRIAELARERLGDDAALVVANVLARQGEARRRYVMKETMDLWVVGQEDI